MAENLILNKRYAKALFNLAEESGQIETVYTDMTLVKKVCQENVSLLSVLKSFVVRHDKKSKIIARVFSETISALALKFILFIIRKGREKCLIGIIDAYIDIYREYKDIVPAILYTTEPADEEIKEQIISVLRQFTQSTIELENKIDKNLIGGFRLFFDGHLYDASLFTKFKKLNRSFSINVYDKSF